MKAAVTFAGAAMGAGFGMLAGGIYVIAGLGWALVAGGILSLALSAILVRGLR